MPGRRKRSVRVINGGQTILQRHAARRERAAIQREAVGEATSLPYEQFIAERQRYVDARQRQQQRVDQLVTGGAAGALALSITFLEKIAPTPGPATRPLLLAAWGLLLLSLGLTLASHYASCDAFDRTITDFDDCYARSIPFAGPNASTRNAARLSRWGAGAFVGGVLFLAGFAFVNLHFATPSARPLPSTTPNDGRPTVSPAPSVPASAPTASATTPVSGVGQTH